MIKIYQIDYFSPVTDISSFSIFGAFCWAYRLINGEKSLTDFLHKFAESPLFLLSSPLPILGSNILFPKPILKMKYEKDISLKDKLDRKKYKKANYVTMTVLNDIIQGKVKYQNDLIVNYEIREKVILSPNEINQFLTKRLNKTVSFSRNLVNRKNNVSENLYMEVGRIPNTEVFIVKFLSDEFINEFQQIIEVLKDLGLGGNKNIGWGKIKIEERKDISLSFNLEHKTNFFLSLSSIIPTDNIDFDKSLYDIHMFKSLTEGSFQPSLIKQKVALLKEGSIIKVKDSSKFAGQLKVVTKKNPNIYHYGIEFPIYMEWNYEQ